MWVEIKQRLVEILATLTPVPDTFYDLKSYIPGFRQDANHYLITVRPTRDTLQAIRAPEIRDHSLSYTIEVTSPQVGTENEVVHEYYIEAYADAITVLLDRYPRLESVPTDSSTGRIGLKGITKDVFIPQTAFQTPRAYPAGGPLNHYSVSIQLQIFYSRTRGGC